MAKWSGSASGTVAVPAVKVWEIARFGELHRWDRKWVMESNLVQGDGCSPGSVRSVVFSYPDGSTGSLMESMTHYNDEEYTYSYEMGENPLGYDGYSCTFSLEDYGNGTTTVNFWFEVDAMEGYSEEAVLGSIETVFRRRISLLEAVAARS